MGRPKKEKKLEQINVMLERSDIEKIERLAKKIGITRGQLMRNLVKNSLDEALLFDKTGFLGVVTSGMDAIRNLRKKLDRGDLKSLTD